MICLHICMMDKKHNYEHLRRDNLRNHRCKDSRKFNMGTCEFYYFLSLNLFCRSFSQDGSQHRAALCFLIITREIARPIAFAAVQLQTGTLKMNMFIIVQYGFYLNNTFRTAFCACLSSRCQVGTNV